MASLLVPVRTVVSLIPPSFSVASRLQPWGSLRLASLHPVISFQITSTMPMPGTLGRKSAAPSAKPTREPIKEDRPCPIIAVTVCPAGLIFDREFAGAQAQLTGRRDRVLACSGAQNPRGTTSRHRLRDRFPRSHAQRLDFAPGRCGLLVPLEGDQNRVLKIDTED